MPYHTDTHNVIGTMCDIDVPALSNHATQLYKSGQFHYSLIQLEFLLNCNLNTLSVVKQCELYTIYCLNLLYTSNYTRCHQTIESTYNQYHHILHHTHSCLPQSNDYIQHNSCNNNTVQCAECCSTNSYVLKRQRYKLLNRANTELSHVTAPKTSTCHNTSVLTACKLYHSLCELVLLKILLNHIAPISDVYADTYDWLHIPEYWPTNTRTIIKQSNIQLYSYLQIIDRLPKYILYNAVNTQQLYSNQNILHVIGDSHILTLSHRTLTINNITYHCMPYLIPGCKAYHIGTTNNKQSSIQRSLYKNYIGCIPVHSHCMILAGEIDCRRSEGISQAVYKHKFNTIDDALHTTVHQYVSQIIQSAHDRQMTALYVHPVRPPYISTFKVRKTIKYQQRKHHNTIQHVNQLDKTIELVYNVALLIRDWNEQLQYEINQQQLHMPSNQRVVHYIDIYDELCDKQVDYTQHTALQYLLRESYSLEGLHLNTKYVTLLESGVNRIVIQPH